MHGDWWAVGHWQILTCHQKSLLCSWIHLVCEWFLCNYSHWFFSRGKALQQYFLVKCSSYFFFFLLLFMSEFRSNVHFKDLESLYIPTSWLLTLSILHVFIVSKHCWPFSQKNRKNRFYFYARIGRNKIIYLILCLTFIVATNIKQRRSSCQYRILSDPNSCVKTKTNIYICIYI